MQCPKCGMGYVPGEADNDAAHEKYCDLICNGPSAGHIGSAGVVWSADRDCVLVVTTNAAVQLRTLAHDASVCANREMRCDGGFYRHYDPPDDRDVHVFLYVRRGRVVAMLLFARRTHVWRCTWNAEGSPTCVEQPSTGPMWSVEFLWTHYRWRRGGIGTALWSVSKGYLRLTDSEVGWYTPFSSDGEQFVRKAYPEHFYVAK
jgi:zinc-finger of acetyl-transferase ESCO